MVGAARATREDRHHRRAGSHGEQGERPRRRRGVTEELHEHSLAAGGVLIHQDADHATPAERLQHRSQGASLVDDVDAGPASQPVGDSVQPGRIEWADDHGQTVVGQPVGGAQDLPVPEVSGEDERPPVSLHGRVQMLDAVEANPGQCLLERRRQKAGQLDQRHPEVLGRPPRESATVRDRQLGVRAAQVGEGDAPSTRHRGVHSVAQSPTEPEGEGQRHPTSRGRQAASGYAERRRRSLYSSTAMGISESTITITTTTWM
jgi:hypothetical protein